MIEKVKPLWYNNYMEDMIMNWKIIEGFTDYKVNENGEVYSIKRNKILKQYEKKNYLGVYLYQDNKRKFRLAHRLVANAFIPNPNNLPQINHKDENSKNNNVENLEWCTQKYNNNYGTYKERVRKRMLENNPFKGKKHSEKSKEKMRLAKIGKESKRKRKVVINGTEYESITKAMEELKIGTKKIYQLLKEENNG